MSVREKGHSFNLKVAGIVSAMLSSMPFFWFAVCLAFLSLPAVVAALEDELGVNLGVEGAFPEWLLKASLISLVAWVAQTFIQLVALPVLAFIGRRGEEASAADTATLLKRTEEIVKALDLKVEGGLESVYKAIAELRELIEQDRT